MSIRRSLVLLGGALAGLATAQPGPRTLPPGVADTTPKAAPTIAPVSAEVRPVAAALDRYRNTAIYADDIQRNARATLIGIEWLWNCHQTDGRFLASYDPALNRRGDDDQFLRQAMSAFVLARAARLDGESRHAARAYQAVMTLLSQTTTEGQTRLPADASRISNRLGGVGYLLAAIHELPQPKRIDQAGALDPLYAKGEELAQFLRERGHADGTFQLMDTATDALSADDVDAESKYPAIATYAVLSSARHRPAAWKVEWVKVALGGVRKSLVKKPSLAAMGLLAAAGVEGYAQTKDGVFATAACEGADAALALQVPAAGDGRAAGTGGFRRGTDAPDLDSAWGLMALAEGVRLTRLLPQPDAARHDRYRAGAALAARFVVGLQYTDDNTPHIHPDYRVALVGGFHPSATDGALRTERSAVACAALMQYLLTEPERH